MVEALGTLSDGTPRQRRYAPRSRGGCITCRRRRKRCSGPWPECDACRRLQLKCTWDGRGRLQNTGPAAVSAPANAEVPRLAGRNSLDPGRDSTLPADWHRRSPALKSPVAMPATGSSPSLIPCDVDQRILMSYYIHSFVPNISVAKLPASFFTSLYVPMAFYCDAVKSAILACASAHLSKATDDDTRSSSLLQLSMRYQRHCHRFLQNRVSLSGTLQQDPLESLTVILLLVGLEVQNGAHTQKWMDQLECVRKIIRQQGGKAAFSQSSWEAECIYHHFLYHDVMGLIMDGVAGRQYPEDDEDDEGRASMGETPKSEDSCLALSHPPPPPRLRDADMPWAKYLGVEETNWTQSLSPGPDSRLGRNSGSSVHCLLGLSRELFFLIQKIRFVKPIGKTTEVVDCSTNGLFLDLERQISTIQFDASSWTGNDEQRLDTGTRLDLLILAETYRLAALIMLYRKSAAHIHRLPVLAEQIIVLVERIPAGNPAEAGLTYPLFLAGAEIISDDLMLRCAAKLITIRERVKVLNIESVEKVLEAVWRERLNGGDKWDWEQLLRRWKWVINLG